MVKKPKKTRQKQALIIENDNNFEVRCGNCGKLLFKIVEKPIDKSNKNVIIVARCTRNDCSTDNLITI